MDAPRSIHSGPFHAGEIAAQERAGVRAQMEKVGAIALRDYMPQQHRDFFPLLTMLFVGARDGQGDVWASALWGEAGFVQSPDPVSLRVGAQLQPGDPIASAIRPGHALGGLGLQFETRRRNRVNGVVSTADAEGFTLDVRQSFGNCAKYIQTRERIDAPEPRMPDMTAGDGASLATAARALIRRSDTFFIASAAGDAADVSHRGGRPGFVQVDTDGVLMWPDFQGNNFFNSIGNLLVDARAGLLFIDFEQGDLLHLGGRTEVVWDGPQVTGFPGARRMLRFVIGRYVFRRGALPMRWALREPSPHLAATGRFE